MHIRPFQPQDEEAVVSLWRQCDLVRPWNDPHKDIQRKLRVRPDLFLVGLLDGRIVATIMAGYEGHRGWLNYLAVSPEHQRHGFGKALVHEAERLLRDAGCPKINLQIRDTNQHVIEFYRRLGYRVDEATSMGKRLEDDTPGVTSAFATTGPNQAHEPPDGRAVHRPGPSESMGIPCSDIAATHQALGEFVIAFQWVENLYRQIGWFILDPDRKEWPPMRLRRESNSELIDKVTTLYVGLTEGYAFPNGAEKARDMLELRNQFHELRKYRNRLLHSAYIELKAGGEVHGYIRSSPDVGTDPDSGELIYEQEDFTAEVIHSKMGEYGEFMFRLNINHVQLIHWHPFARYQRGG